MSTPQETPAPATTPAEGEAKKEAPAKSPFALDASKIKPFAIPQQSTNAQDDGNNDDSHKEAPSTSADQPDPDENEDCFFADKANLYRFDKATNEWKERGTGVLKILRNKETNRCRLLMRRNQTFRVCANHFVLPFLKLKPFSGTDRAFIWTAPDFADGTESHDTLSVRFKTKEIAASFKEAFEKAQKINDEELKKTEAQPKEEKKE